MAQLTHVERRAGLVMLISGSLLGIGITLAFFGFFWLPLSAVGLSLVATINFFASNGRVLDFESWLSGASGESRVRQVLRELEPLGYAVIGDVDMGGQRRPRRRRADRRVRDRDEESRRAGRGRSRRTPQRLAPAGCTPAVREAIWVRDRAGVRFVEAFLVYPTAKVEPDVVRLQNVTVMSLPRLNAEITSHRRSLPADEIERIKQALSAPSR